MVNMHVVTNENISLCEYDSFTMKFHYYTVTTIYYVVLTKVTCILNTRSA